VVPSHCAQYDCCAFYQPLCTSFSHRVDVKSRSTVSSTLNCCLIILSHPREAFGWRRCENTSLLRTQGQWSTGLGFDGPTKKACLVAGLSRPMDKPTAKCHLCLSYPYVFSKPLECQDLLSQHIRSSRCARYQKGYLLRGMLFIGLGGPEKPMGWASMKSLSGPAHGLEPTAQQLRPLLPGHSLSGDSGKYPASIASCSFAVLIRGLPALVSLAGAVDAGGTFGGDSDDCCRLKGSLAGVRGLPGVLFTRV
jgi:hypothetical protein